MSRNIHFHLSHAAGGPKSNMQIYVTRAVEANNHKSITVNKYIHPQYPPPPPINTPRWCNRTILSAKCVQTLRRPVALLTIRRPPGLRDWRPGHFPWHRRFVIRHILHGMWAGRVWRHHQTSLAVGGADTRLQDNGRNVLIVRTRMQFMQFTCSTTSDKYNDKNNEKRF